MAPLGMKPVVLVSTRPSSAPTVACIVAVSSRDMYARTTERTPQWRLYRSPLCFLASAITARRIEQSINCIVSNHVGMFLSAPTSNRVSGRMNGPSPYVYRKYLETRPARVRNSTAMIMARTIVFVRITSSMIPPSLDTCVEIRTLSPCPHPGVPSRDGALLLHLEECPLSRVLRVPLDPKYRSRRAARWNQSI